MAIDDEIEKHLKKDITERMGTAPLYMRGIAKAQIWLGAISFSAGLLYGDYVIKKMDDVDMGSLLQIGIGVAAMALGTYLISSANRSMIYKSMNMQTDYLEKRIVEYIRQKDKNDDD